MTGVKQDTSAFYATAPQRLSNFDRKALEGKWWKVRGYNAKYDCFRARSRRAVPPQCDFQQFSNFT